MQVSETKLEKMNERLYQLEMQTALNNQKLDDVSKKLDEFKAENDERRWFWLKLLAAPFAAGVIAWILSGGMGIMK